MTSSPVIVSLPIADRQTSYRFYREALGFDAARPTTACPNRSSSRSTTAPGSC